MPSAVVIRGVRRAARTKRVLALLAIASTIALIASCSLDLDEALITRGDGGGDPFESGAPDSPIIEGGVDTGIPTGPDATTCANDDPCKTTHACLKGKCDLARKKCAYDVCRGAICQGAVCDVQKATCGAGAPYKFLASKFNIGQLTFGRCLAAVHPFLFVATPTGVVAYNVSNPAATAPPQVPISGLGFIPSQIIASGSRVWFYGGVSGPGPSKLVLAYIDVPPDPFVPRLQATSALVTYNRAAAEGVSLFARGGDSLLFVGPLVPQYPAAFLEAPVAENASITATPITFPAGVGPRAVSGKRLLLSNAAGQNNLVDNAGSTSPVTGPVGAITDAGEISGNQTWAQSPDGAIFWLAGVHTQIPNPPGPPVTVTRAVKGYFLVPNETGPFEPNVGLDIEVYNGAVQPGAGAGVVGPLAMLDSKTAMIVTLAKENDMQTAIQFVQREPALGVIKEGAGPRRQVLTVPLGVFTGAAASNGIGYLAAHDTPGPPATASIYVFDPGCAP